MKVVVPLTVVSLILSILIGLSFAKGGGIVAPPKDEVPTVVGDRAHINEKHYTIGISLDTLKEQRWQIDKAAMEARAKELGIELVIQTANSDDTRQVQDVQGLITRNVDLIIIVPHNGTAMTKAVNEAKAAGIPVIAYDRLIQDCDLDLYITFNNFKVGEAQAQYLVDKIGGKGNIIRIYGSPVDNNAKTFKEGQDSILKPYIDRGDIKVVHEDWATNWDPAQATKITNAAITKVRDNFDGILASNDGTAQGAIQALKAEGYAGKKIVTGQDAELVALQRILGGTQSMTIYKPLKKLATAAINCAVDMLDGKTIATDGTVNNGKIDVPAKYSDVIAVDKDNIDLVIEEGMFTREQVYGKK